MRLTPAQAKLAEDNHNLIYWYMQKMGLDISEWYGICAIGLCKAAASYDPGKGKFSTHAYWCMQTARSTQMRKNRKDIDAYAFSLDNAEDSVNDYMAPLNRIPAEDATQAVDARLSVQKIIGELSPASRRIYSLAFRGAKQKTIAEITGIQQSGVSRYIKQARKKIRDEIQITAR